MRDTGQNIRLIFQDHSYIILIGGFFSIHTDLKKKLRNIPELFASNGVLRLPLLSHQPLSHARFHQDDEPVSRSYRVASLLQQKC